MSIAMNVLIDYLTDHPADRWTETDWALLSTAVDELRRTGWPTPGAMVPVLHIMDSVWCGWAGMSDQHREQAMEMLDILDDMMGVSIHCFLDDLKSGRYEHELALEAAYGGGDKDEDDEDVVPF